MRGAARFVVVVAASMVLGSLVGVGPAAANSRPEAVNDTFGAIVNIPLVVPAPGVLANDVDPDGDPLRIYPDLLPGGAVDLRPDGSFTFTPPPNFQGVYAFDYYAYDGAIVNECCAHVYINVGPGATARNDTYTARPDRRLNVVAPGVLANDAGAGARLERPAAFGTVRLRRSGGFTYTPPPGFTGTDTFTYRTYSGIPGQVSLPATVTITVGAG